MSAITDILDRLSGVNSIKEQLITTNRNVERSLDWLLDHEKRLLRLESNGHDVTPPSKTPRLPRKRS